MIKFEKKYLSFAELKEKWQITSDELHYLIQGASVIPAIAWKGYARNCHWEANEDGKSVLTITNYENKFTPIGWLYLRQPKVAGNSDYKFTYATNTPYANYEASIFDVWFRLLDGFDEIASASIGIEYIEENAVFMAEVIDDAEILELGLIEPFNRDLVINNPASQNPYSTDLMNILNLAVNKFFNPRQKVDPKKDEITEWLKAKGKELNVNVSDNVADAIFTIIKPNDHNPKIKRA